MEEFIRAIRQSALLTSRFGRWPSFHDAEVLRVKLERRPRVRAEFEIYAFHGSAEVDSSGYYKKVNECVVTIAFEDISHISLADFNQQNVLSSLIIEFRDGSFEVSFEWCFGLSARIVCTEIVVADVHFMEGNPEEWRLAYLSS